MAVYDAHYVKELVYRVRVTADSEEEALDKAYLIIVKHPTPDETYLVNDGGFEHDYAQEVTDQ